MDRKVSTTNWTFGISFNAHVDFCVWVLEVDGLSVPPFDSHGRGDRSLRDRGLDAGNWHDWVRKVVESDLQLAGALRDMARESSLTFPGGTGVPDAFGAGTLPLTDEERARAQALLAQYEPPAVWTGSVAPGDRLEDLWEAYRWISRYRSRRAELEGPDLHDVRPGLVDDGEARIPNHLWIRLVDYKGPVDYPIAPSDVIMGLRGWRPDPPAFRAYMTQAIDRLVHSSTVREE